MTPRRLTAVIRGYGWAGLVDDVLDFLAKCKSSFDVQPDFFHFSCALHICLEEKRLDAALRVFCRMDLIAGLLNAKQAKEVALLFVQMVSRRIILPYCITRTNILKAFSQAGQVKIIDDIYDEMRSNHLLPNVSIFKEFIRDHCEDDISSETQKVLNAMVSTLESVTYFRTPKDEGPLDTEKGDDPDVSIFDHVIYSLSMHEKSSDAYHLIVRMTYHPNIPTTETPTLSTSMVLFDALCASCKWAEAEQVLILMMEWGHMPNQSTLNSWVQGYCKAGQSDEVYNFLTEFCDNDLVLEGMSYNVLVDKLCLAGRLEEAKKVTKEVRRNAHTQDVGTFSRMIHSFAKAGDFEVPCKLLGEMVEMGLVPFALPFTPLVERLCIAGKMEEAMALIDEIEGKGCKPLSSLYTWIVCGYCNAKQLQEAFRLIDTMKSKESLQRSKHINCCLNAVWLHGSLSLQLKLK